MPPMFPPQFQPPEGTTYGPLPAEAAQPKMFIMQGLPGSGKSHWARLALELNPGAIIVSTDDYPGLYIRDTQGRVVGFNSHLLGRAHGACFKGAIYHAQNSRTVIVDNTNTTLAEMAPYVMVAAAYGLTPIICRVTADPDLCAARGTHNVPRDVINRLSEHLRQFVAPAHWKDIPGYGVRDLKGGP